MSFTPQYHKLGILKLPELYTLEIAKLMQQYSHHTLPQPFSTFFTPFSPVHERFTRAKTENKVYFPKFSTACFQKSFKYEGAKIWNSILTEIRQLTFHKFKIEYKKKNIWKLLLICHTLYHHHNRWASNFLKNNVALSDCSFRVTAWLKDQKYWPLRSLLSRL